MENRGKQRLIGVILLLLMAAILAPVVFRSSHQVQVKLNMDLPEPPPVTGVDPQPVIPDSRRQDTRQQIDNDRQAALNSARQYQKDSTPKPGERRNAMDSPPLSGWSVQVASFSHQDAAEKLDKRLRDADYNAYWRQVEQDGKTLYRVYAGPELKMDNVETLKRRIANDKKFRLQGIVVPYQP